MANKDQPRGFELIGYKDGKINGSINPYYVPSTYGTQLVVGDPVVKTGTSNAATVSQGSRYRRGALPEINRAVEKEGTTDNPVIGIINGFAPLPDEEDKGAYNPANTERVVLVSDDPNALYRAQFASSSTTGSAIGSVGLNFDCAFDEDPDLINGTSGAELYGLGGSTLAIQQFKLERFEDVETNDIDIAHPKGIVSINNHQGVPNTAGV